jgi:putative heme-binding domain-containing protein
MPHLGSEYPDWEALKIVHRWISAMKKPDGAPDAPLIRNGGIEGGLSASGNALLFARGLGGGAMSDDYGNKVIAAAGKLPPGPVRDLFEGYLPPDPKGRKLGSNPRPASILALTGDAKNGEALFFQKEMKCANCHNVGDRGKQLGADLTAIGKIRTRAELLDSLLNPSARIDPQFAAYNVKTKDEKTYTGLLLKRNAAELILRDAENKETKLAADDVESVRPSRLSLMPDGQMSALTPQEAADLLEFLVQRKGP